jgi:hypothetical protein
MKNTTKINIERKQEISQSKLLSEFITISPKLKSYLFRILAHKEDTEDLLRKHI